MIVELGHFALILWLFVAVAQAGLGLLGGGRNNALLMVVSGPAAIARSRACPDDLPWSVATRKR